MTLTEEHVANRPMRVDQTIAPGDIVDGLEPTELVEVTRIAPFAGKMLVEGITVESRRQIKRPLTPEQVRAAAPRGEPRLLWVRPGAVCPRGGRAVRDLDRLHLPPRGLPEGR